MISEEEKLKFQKYFKNIGLAMNNPNGFGPIMNKNLPMHIIGGCSNWYSIYNIKKQNQNQYQINSTKKLNAQFITTTGLNINSLLFKYIILILYINYYYINNIIYIIKYIHRYK